MFFPWERCKIGFDIAVVRETGTCRIGIVGGLNEALIRSSRALVEVWETAVALAGPAQLEILVPQHTDDAVAIQVGWPVPGDEEGLIQKMLNDVVEYLVHAEKVLADRYARVKVNLFDVRRRRRIRDPKRLLEEAANIVRTWPVFANYFVRAEVFDPSTKRYVER